jgi:crossover junction endodeoxyribonuclease RuvC
MRILGIDPGTRVAGYGIVEVGPTGEMRAVAVGAWHLNAKQPLAARLGTLALEFRRVVALHAPDCVCVELPFVANNSRSALVLGTARGVILAEAHLHGLAIAEIGATAAKKAVTADGYANKEKVARVLGALLRVDFSSVPHDATDALAIAYAHAFRTRVAVPTVESGSPDPARAAVLRQWAEASKRRRKSRSGWLP